MTEHIERVDTEDGPDVEVPDNCVLLLHRDAEINEYDGHQVHKGEAVSDLDVLDLLIDVLNGLGKSLTTELRETLTNGESEDENREQEVEDTVEADQESGDTNEEADKSGDDELSALERRAARLDEEVAENTAYTREEIVAIAFDKDVDEVTDSNKAYLYQILPEADLELETMPDPNSTSDRNLYYHGEQPDIGPETDTDSDTERSDETAEGAGAVHPDYVADCPHCDYSEAFQDTDEAAVALDTHLLDEHPDEVATEDQEHDAPLAGSPPDSSGGEDSAAEDDTGKSRMGDAPTGHSDDGGVPDTDDEDAIDEIAPVSAEDEQLNDTVFTTIEEDPSETSVEDEVTDDITDVLPDDISIEDLSKAHLIKLLHYRTDRSQEEIMELVGATQSYVSSVTNGLPETQEPEVVGSLHECRANDVVRYVKCIECDAVFDLDAVENTGRPKWDNEQDPITHVDWFQHNEFEGYVVKPEGEEPPARPRGAVKNHRVIEE
ncbi:hypothetical protein HTZ84_21000 [Haloterrigena sp. SYSU A558-1]|uniref:HTH cro/C1-type domain-containing protein n=1 Tax=Haloterrigena gelatinilytica TaxID=2741724 RepID=A0ABX2LH94_9EURY|nr:hypothetical protein [Haloterrigena gelatinilytica]NUC74743.1 hypothetical protein [Haloterrigena gelatinilytica]